MCAGFEMLSLFFERNNVKVWNEEESCSQKNLGQSAGGLELTLSNSQFLGENWDSVSLLFFVFLILNLPFTFSLRVSAKPFCRETLCDACKWQWCTSQAAKL